MSEQSMVSIPERTRAKTIKKDKFYTPKACNECHRSKLKCCEVNQQGLSCARCVKKSLECSWSPKPRPYYARLGAGSYKSEEGRRHLVEILPQGSIAPNITVAVATPVEVMPTVGVPRVIEATPPVVEDITHTVSPDPADIMDEFLGHGLIAEEMEDGDQQFINSSQSLEDFDRSMSFSWEISPEFPQLFFPTSGYDFGYFPLPGHMPFRQLQAANGVNVEEPEYTALGHYQSTFSIYRTTKKPAWSTHMLLLNKSDSNRMIMHFILAVSINDIANRKGDSPSQRAHEHFERAELALSRTASDHTTMMISFLFQYLYLPKRESFSQTRIQTLSNNVYTYLSQHNLDSRCLEHSFSSSPSTNTNNPLTTKDRTLLARLIIWIYDEDVKCAFQGYGGALATYLTLHRARTMAVCEVSRTALGAHWGTDYPVEEVADDEDNALELEFLWALTTLWHEINELDQGKEGFAVESTKIERRFVELNKRYYAVFVSSALLTLPRTRTQINADYDVILYNALKIYFFRATLPSSSLNIPTPPDIQAVLTAIVVLLERTFASDKNDLHDRLQWPLFLTGIELRGVGEGFGIAEKIQRRFVGERLPRGARAVLEGVWERQDGGVEWTRLSMVDVRALLCCTSGEREGFGGGGSLAERGFVMGEMSDL